MSKRTPLTIRTASAPLLFWLLIVCGLAGVTAQRIDALGDVLPLWLGTVGGVAIGQLVGALRVRAWLIAIVAFAGLWLTSVLFAAMPSFGGGLKNLVLAFVPAAICGYLSLSERGGLIAFWYPAVLWMLVILDGPDAGGFNARGALPFLVGLGGLFVAFLRARETRRAAIWRDHATVRLAKALPRTVLRTSPLRSASQLVWTGLIGTATLVMAAWIAPNLWQEDVARHLVKHPSAGAGAALRGSSDDSPCCPENPEEDTRTRVREYFLLDGHDSHDSRPPVPACSPCRDGQRFASSSDGTSGGMSADTGGLSGPDVPPYAPSTDAAGTSYGQTATYGGGTTTASGTPPAFSPMPPATLMPARTPAAEGATQPPKKKKQNGVVPPVPTVVPPPVVPPVPTVAMVPMSARVAAAKPADLLIVPKPAAPAGSAPWKSVLAFCMGGLALHVLVRAIRRQLTLRHLKRPFWPETLDQRISNHWQRMLIGLRDAGIHPALDEQPQALAERVAIDGMGTCATILERVRHGVRVDAADLEAMDGAAGAVYGAARERAGLSGRAAAWLRWPLA